MNQRVVLDFRQSLGLLSRRSRTRLAVAFVLQSGTSLIDLAGVMALGIVVALSVNAVAGGPLPSVLLESASILGLEANDLGRLLGWITLAGALLLAAKPVVSFLLTRRLIRFLANRQAEVSGNLLREVMRWPPTLVHAWPSQRLTFALTGGVQLAVSGVLGQAVIAGSETVLLMVLLAGLFFVSPWVTLGTLLYLSVIGVVLHVSIAQRASLLGQEAAGIEIRTRQSIKEGLETYEELVVLNRRDAYVDDITNLRWSAARNAGEAQIVGLLPKYVFETALVIGAILLVVSQLGSRELPAALGTISVFLLAGLRMVPSLQRLQTAAVTARQSAAGAEGTYELAGGLNRAADIAALDGEADTAALEKGWACGQGALDWSAPGLRLQNVTFRYDDAAIPTISNVSFSCEPGNSVALVGPSGAGKSTVASLILGLLSPVSGEILIDGRSPREVIHTCPGMVAYVPQEVALIDASVRQNIALGVPQGDIDDQLVAEALERAHLGAFLEELRDGLDTQIGERGIRLSGGQRQRLGLARALYTRPSLLVLDEATSALDSETERAVAETMREIGSSVTIVTIAHRLATVAQSDLVVYLDKGIVVATGTFPDVRQAVPQFDGQAKLLGL